VKVYGEYTRALTFRISVPSKGGVANDERRPGRDCSCLAGQERALRGMASMGARNQEIVSPYLSRLVQVWAHQSDGIFRMERTVQEAGAPAAAGGPGNVSYGETHNAHLEAEGGRFSSSAPSTSPPPSPHPPPPSQPTSQHVSLPSREREGGREEELEAGDVADSERFGSSMCTDTDSNIASASQVRGPSRLPHPTILDGDRASTLMSGVPRPRWLPPLVSPAHKKHRVRTRGGKPKPGLSQASPPWSRPVTSRLWVPQPHRGALSCRRQRRIRLKSGGCCKRKSRRVVCPARSRLLNSSSSAE
jgi:hypothetical protein